MRKEFVTSGPEDGLDAVEGCHGVQPLECTRSLLLSPPVTSCLITNDHHCSRLAKKPNRRCSLVEDLAGRGHVGVGARHVHGRVGLDLCSRGGKGQGGKEELRRMRWCRQVAFAGDICRGAAPLDPCSSVPQPPSHWPPQHKRVRARAPHIRHATVKHARTRKLVKAAAAGRLLAWGSDRAFISWVMVVWKAPWASICLGGRGGAGAGGHRGRGERSGHVDTGSRRSGQRLSSMGDSCGLSGALARAVYTSARLSAFHPTCEFPSRQPAHSPRRCRRPWRRRGGRRRWWRHEWRPRLWAREAGRRECTGRERAVGNAVNAVND